MVSSRAETSARDRPAAISDAAATAAISANRSPRRSYSSRTKSGVRTASRMARSACGRGNRLGTARPNSRRAASLARRSMRNAAASTRSTNRSRGPRGRSRIIRAARRSVRTRSASLRLGQSISMVSAMRVSDRAASARNADRMRPASTRKRRVNSPRSSGSSSPCFENGTTPSASSKRSPDADRSARACFVMAVPVTPPVPRQDSIPRSPWCRHAR